jgi:hypothetical protein
MIQMQFVEILSLVKKGDCSSTHFALVRIKWIPVLCSGFTCPWHHKMSLCKMPSAAALLRPTGAGFRQAGKQAMKAYNGFTKSPVQSPRAIKTMTGTTADRPTKDREQ